MVYTTEEYIRFRKQHVCNSLTSRHYLMLERYATFESRNILVVGQNKQLVYERDTTKSTVGRQYEGAETEIVRTYVK